MITYYCELNDGFLYNNKHKYITFSTQTRSLLTWRYFTLSDRVWVVNDNAVEFFKHRTIYPYPEVDLEELSFVILSSVLIGEIE